MSGVQKNDAFATVVRLGGQKMSIRLLFCIVPLQPTRVCVAISWSLNQVFWTHKGH